jgi:hypothetical protein
MSNEEAIERSYKIRELKEPYQLPLVTTPGYLCRSHPREGQNRQTSIASQALTLVYESFNHR